MFGFVDSFIEGLEETRFERVEDWRNDGFTNGRKFAREEKKKEVELDSREKADLIDWLGGQLFGWLFGWPD